MSWSVDVTPLIDWRLIAALAVAAAIVSVIGLIRQMPGAWLRALAAALLVLALLDPALKQEDREILPGVVAIVIDTSASQTLGERAAETAAARADLEARLARLRGFEPRWIEVGSAGTDGTELFSALERGLADVPSERISGVVLITDGQVHDIPERREQLGFDAPVHALVTGNREEIDRRLVVHASPRFGIVGQDQPITFRLEDFGPVAAASPRRAQVTISRDGDPVSTMSVTVGENVTVPVEIAHGGRNIVELEAEALPGELTLLNNRAVVTVAGIRDNLRVLLVSGEPHAGERTWRNILKSDAAVDLVHFTILRPPEKQDGTPISQLSLIAFPTRELFSVKIDEFDLIIFDRYQSRGVLPVLYYDNIARYVANGGAVLVAAGPEYAEQGSLFRTPLGPVLPAVPTGSIVEQPYRAALSEAGGRHPITRDLVNGGEEPTWSRWFRLVDATVEGGETLMTGPDGRPLLVVDREGQGRVALMLSDHAWLWARGYEGGGPYIPLLRRLAHWLMKETDLEEEALTATGRGDELMIERRTMSESVPPALVETPAGETVEVGLTEVEPGLWRGETPIRDLGIYRIANGDLTTLASIGPDNPREFAEVRSDTEQLAPLARATGGGVFRIAERGSVSLPRVLPMHAATSLHGSDWIGLKTSEASVLRGVRALPLLAGLAGLVLLLAALTAAWYREGR
ncbi:hypothetical protein EDC22_101465 [Tepidamorphus gemmatus]|jgi:hypothetical protein|uniref:Glutamine amidotransferase n=1 Tax=Tepidamorphus gemmatus TaxID=747076 RepID=A0A4R3MHS8_9HYPH|nr:hypothetical protein [Tepidamorphus gemmatus]TCT13595.1 hypothetical protein EDC22_101465 [Tepidamorphus gemmatus]